MGWPEQMMGSPWCQPCFKEFKMHLGSPIPGISLSVPDCDQETLLLILFLHWAVTSRGDSL